MKIEVIKNEPELLEIEITGEETLTHLIARFCDADCAAIRDHPFLTEPRIVVSGKKPAESVIKACDNILAALEEFKDHFSREVK